MCGDVGAAIVSRRKKTAATLVEKGSYLLQLFRFIHLNLIWAKMKVKLKQNPHHPGLAEREERS
jgi:hypothetical protein